MSKGFKRPQQKEEGGTVSDTGENASQCHYLRTKTN